MNSYFSNSIDRALGSFKFNHLTMLEQIMTGNLTSQKIYLTNEAEGDNKIAWGMEESPPLE